MPNFTPAVNQKTGDEPPSTFNTNIGIWPILGSLLVLINCINPAATTATVDGVCLWTNSINHPHSATVLTAKRPREHPSHILPVQSSFNTNNVTHHSPRQHNQSHNAAPKTTMAKQGVHLPFTSMTYFQSVHGKAPIIPTITSFLPASPPRFSYQRPLNLP